MKRHRQISLLGYPGVGKSTLVGQFVYKTFFKEYYPNVESQIRHSCVVHGQEYDLLVVDNAGADPYTINHSEFHNSDSYIIVYSIDDKASFDMVPIIREKIISNSTSSRVPLVIVGNKTDRTICRVITAEQGLKLATGFGVEFIETSAKDKAGVDDIFVKCIHAMNQDMNDDNDSNNNNNTSTSATILSTRTTNVKNSRTTCTLS